MEIITGVERRRRWRLYEILRIAAETEQPGASFIAVARRHQVSRLLLWNWRQQVRSGDLGPELMPMFVPLQITPDLPQALAAPHPAPMPARSPAHRRHDPAQCRQADIRTYSDAGPIRQRDLDPAIL